MIPDHEINAEMERLPGIDRLRAYRNCQDRELLRREQARPTVWTGEYGVGPDGYREIVERQLRNKIEITRQRRKEAERDGDDRLARLLREHVSALGQSLSEHINGPSGARIRADRKAEKDAQQENVK